MTSQFKKVCVIGLGYIGLPTAAMFASRKINVVGVDVNEAAVDTINRGDIHIIEPDLDMIVHAAVQEGYLRATTAPEPAEAFLIAVPTPFRGEGHEPDLSYIEAASRAIAPMLAKGNLVILESTSPVGATEAMADWLAKARPDLSFPQDAGESSDIRIAHCPERVLPGKVMEELITNSRVIGGLTPSCSALAVELYKNFVTGDCVVASSPRVAELAKLAENSFRDVNIAFANELANVCDTLSIDVWETLELANKHPRVNILRPGPGVGGHCIAVDPWFIVDSAPKDTKLIKVARNVNDCRPGRILRNIIARASMLSERLQENDLTIALLGLSFKPNIDDLRESPAVKVAQLVLKAEIGNVVLVEPNISQLPNVFEGLGVRLEPLSEALEKANLICVLVEHSQFQEISPEQLIGKEVISACNDLRALLGLTCE